MRPRALAVDFRALLELWLKGRALAGRASCAYVGNVAYVVAVVGKK